MIDKLCSKNKLHLLIIFGMVCIWLFSAVDSYAKNDSSDKRILNSDSESASDISVYLYFADNTNQYLKAEERTGIGSDDPVKFCRQIIEALVQGPFSGLVPTIPVATQIRGIYFDDKTVYVDFSREIETSHPGGIQSELLTIYSIVNTLVLNVDGVDQVKIIIAGQEAETLSGHIDIRFPLQADMLLIR